jgi:hypothetical protein
MVALVRIPDLRAYPDDEPDGSEALDAYSAGVSSAAGHSRGRVVGINSAVGP